MKNKIITMILAILVTGALVTGCGAAKQEAASAPAEQPAPAEQTEAAAEPAEEEVIPGDEDQSDMPSDFLQIRENKVDFKDYDEIISLLKDGEGYAIINVYGSDEPVLAITEQAFTADGSASEASLYVMYEGKPHSMGIVAGNGSAYPLRIDDKGIIYGGDNHNYETSFMTSDGIPGIMQKDYLYDGVSSGDGSIGGFTREDNTSFDSTDFTGTQEDFDKYIEAREALPIIEFTIVGDADAEGASSPYEKALEIYKDEIAHSNADTYAAFADLDDECEALLICSNDDIFTDDEGNIYSTAATVYCLDAEGDVSSFGTVSSGTTALPLAVKDHTLYTGNHNELFSTTLDRENISLKEESSENFDAVEDAVQITFTPISELQAQINTEPLPAYTYTGDDALLKAVYEYLATTYRSDYNPPEAEATIPIVVEVARDDKNDADIVIYGDFYINNYSKSGDTLMANSGGEYPGAIHLKKDGDTYTVTKMEVVGDGSDFNPTAKKIFGDNYDAFMKANADEKAREKARIEAIADYVKANNLDITQYKDYGWDPVKIK
ncbi:MAG: hypothetical protein K6F99_07325 [Lachnospiraceae bacterium]|nr:hypothetical protein [Lachnospiraceae bacterium]